MGAANLSSCTRDTADLKLDDRRVFAPCFIHFFLQEKSWFGELFEDWQGTPSSLSDIDCV